MIVKEMNSGTLGQDSFRTLRMPHQLFWDVTMRRLPIMIAIIVTLIVSGTLTTGNLLPAHPIRGRNSGFECIEHGQLVVHLPFVMILFIVKADAILQKPAAVHTAFLAFVRLFDRIVIVINGGIVSTVEKPTIVFPIVTIIVIVRETKSQIDVIDRDVRNIQGIGHVILRK